ncbi:hypothetical protein PCANC_16694 [Puccinia coronata f. sp. avenae]|uniref:Uncharacterized protein n=1 Tax=Puccinia coronata f. sp. avenae TaxID=200324 RepID=A0A2N5SJC3_9BASI|nr:hypothetical protein PCANC_16694 [Puccinia coronata f. sp. avenae]
MTTQQKTQPTNWPTPTPQRRRRTARARLGGSALLAGLLLLSGSIVPAVHASPADEPSSGTTHSPLAGSSLQPINLSPPSLQSNQSDISPADYVCQPISPCQPCPLEDLNNPVCEIYHNRRLLDCIYLGSSSPALIASILRNPNTYATGLMIHHTWIQPLPTIDTSSTPEAQPTTSSTTTTTTTTTARKSRSIETELEESSSKTSREYPTQHSHQDKIGAGLGGAEFQTWEACERVVMKEQQDFYEFFLCNLVITAISLVVYGFRTKQLVIKQYGRLAARIGILPS